MTRRADGQDPDIGYMIVYGQVRRIDLLPPAVSPTAVSPANVRTRAGIGIGSTEQLLWQTYGASLKVAPHAYTGADGGRTFTLAPSGGRSGILFETFNGQVTLIRTGLRPELGYVEGCS